jgi:hypothetical protein
MYKVIISVFLCFFMLNVAAADSRLPFGYRAGDSFSCISDALITIGADSEIIEYKNEAFGMQINQTTQLVLLKVIHLIHLEKS